MDSAASAPRLAAMSRNGRFVAIRQQGGVDIVDALGVAPRISISIPNLTDFACLDSHLWAVAGGEVCRYSLEGGKKTAETTQLAFEHGRLAEARTEHANSALWLGESSQLLSLIDNEMRVEVITDELGDSAFATSLGGRRVLVGNERFVRVHDIGGNDVTTASLPNGDVMSGGGLLFGGRALSVLSQSEDGSALIVFRPNGALVHSVPLPKARACAIADVRGLAVIVTENNNLIAVDLRFGKRLGEIEAPITVYDLAIDANGKYMSLAGFGEEEPLSVLHLTYAEIFGTRTRVSDEEVTLDEDGHARSDASAAEPAPQPLPERTEAPDPQEVKPIVIPDVHLEALGKAHVDARPPAPQNPEPYESSAEHLQDLLELVATRTALAIADAWDSGRLSLPSLDARPFEREVFALVGGRIDGAPEQLSLARERVGDVLAHIGRRQQASLAQGDRLPFVDISTDFELSPIAARILLVVAAPALRGEIARLYGVLANDEARPICDRHLVQMVLAGDDPRQRHELASELSVNSALVRHGLVRVLPSPNDHYLFAPLTVDPVLLARLRGDAKSFASGEITTLRESGRDRLLELAAPEELKRELVLALAHTAHDGSALRLVLRGRPGAGRRTMLTALAARAGKPLAVINADRLPRAGRKFADSLRVELRRAALRGAVPCISGLEVLDQSDSEATELVRAVFRSNPGPITIRTSPEFKPPLDPGYRSFALPPLTEGQRNEFWLESLGRHGLEAHGVPELASRFRIGPGTIESVVSTVASRRKVEPDAPADSTDALDKASRQHIDSRLGRVANPVTRLATWEQVALPEDVLDSIREFLGRVQHRRTVYETWGYDSRMTTSRGLTALFHGPPGTGKSMVAGLIARELSLDLYRIDLAQVTSKWIGETEKNLAEVFDAAEDGQVVILFDEADSLFAKRTEVKSSVDRYANLEVNYLLQRLDTFEGIAILTTNMEGSLDTAFKRRLSLRLGFPFPDEEMRTRLWLAHIPPEVPTRGNFNFADLAKRFPMSGGYIRNSALRAAFLAAQEGEPLTQEHIERAIHLEYREMGKLSPGGRME